MPGGHTAETRFQTFHVAEPPAPGLRVFACQHLTPEATWVPGLMDHANTAEGLDAIEVLAADPRRRGAGSARMLDRARWRSRMGRCGWRRGRRRWSS